MLDRKALLEEKISYYNNPKFLENPSCPAGFAGTFAISDHTKIPDVFHGFLKRYFGVYKLRRVSLEKINEVLNDVWEGPGSLEKVFRMEQDLLESGKEIKFTAADLAAIKSKVPEDDIEPEVNTSEF